MMLLYHRPAPAKTPKRRSRAGCMHCKEKKKKCNEERPQCDRCLERGLKCQYEPVKPRKRRRTTSGVDEEARARSVTSDPGPHAGFRGGFPVGIPSSVRSALEEFRPHSTPSSTFDEHWEDDGPSGFDSPVSNTADLALESVDGLPPLTELENGATAGSSGIRKSRPDFPLTSSVHSPIISGYPCSPSTPAFVPGLAMASTSHHELRLSTPVSNGSPGEVPRTPFLDFRSRYAEYSPKPNRQALVEHFCSVLSHLVVFTDDSMNPLQYYILPMALQSQPVMNAIFALSAAHMEHRGLRNEERSLDFHSQSLQGLAHLIADHHASRDEAMAVIILLIYYEVVRNGSPAVCGSHLRGALSIMRARGSHRSPTSNFLERAFAYFDVICALSFGTPPMSGSIMPPPNEKMFPAHDLSLKSAVDSIFGFMGDLWPLMHRITHLLELKKDLDTRGLHSPDKSTTRMAEFESSCVTLELALHQWTPKALGTPGAIEPSMEDSRMQAILNNAEANKRAALVYLYRTVQRCPRKSARVQTPVKQGLQACLRVILFGGPMTALLWPLFNLGAEAVDDVDRSVARTVFRHLESRQGMETIVQAWEVVKETWHRHDAGDESDWGRVCFDLNRSLILG